jgi:hypothetical protein
MAETLLIFALVFEVPTGEEDDEEDEDDEDDDVNDDEYESVGVATVLLLLFSSRLTLLIFAPGSLSREVTVAREVDSPSK